MQRLKNILIFILAGVLFFPAAAFSQFAEPDNGDYDCSPVFATTAVDPNILIILDNSTSMLQRAYSGDYDPNTEYYGLFEPNKPYLYVTDHFERDADGNFTDADDWNGNFLNWATMRRIDVVRKVLMGGKKTAVNLQVQGEDHTQAIQIPTPGYADMSGAVSPGHGTKTIVLKNGYFEHSYKPPGFFSTPVSTGPHNVIVTKDASYADEADNFLNGALAGVLQEIGADARWGNLWFLAGTGTGQSGGDIGYTVAEGVGTTFDNYVNDFGTRAPDNDWTPLGEAYYMAMQYFMQEEPEANYDYLSNADDRDTDEDDPYYYDPDFLSCADSFVILITDGASTKDAKVPDSLKDFADSFDTFVTPYPASDPTGNTVCDESTGTGCEYTSGGTDYLKDVALYARTTDLRSDISGDQNVYLYTIYAFGSDANARNLLKEAAKNGGYTEKDNVFGPSIQAEWDEDGDDDPDTYFEASDGNELKRNLLSAINDILAQTASGTAVSVLATSGEGQGSLVQAFFKPTVTVDNEDYEWLGYLKSMWVDSRGNLREDTNANRTLDIAADKIIVHFSDASGDTKIKKFNVGIGSEYPDTSGTADEIIEIDEIKAIWEAGELLAEGSAADRKIFTYIDKSDDDPAEVDDTGNDPFDDSDEVVRFHTGSAAAIKPYLGVQDDATWAYLAGTGGAANTHDNRVTNLIEYIRGNDIPGLRSRTFDYDDDSTDETWKLGDIIHSTPVTVAKPPDNYHTIYSDDSYQDFYDAFKDRENVVYVGSNDGMLHAFTSWKYDSTNLQYTDPDSSSGMGIGDELWAYIPQALLPHLKWLPSTNYSHVYYVDMKPKIFDAKILDDDTHYTDADTGPNQENWGTFLLVGLNLGGGDIAAEEDFGSGVEIRNFSPSYVLLDITEPRAPRVMWERSYDGLQASASTPAIIRVKDKWFAVFGSGPSGCTGESTQSGKVYVVDLVNGDPYQLGTDDWLFVTGESNAFMNSPVALDKEINSNVDAVYFGETYEDPVTMAAQLSDPSIPDKWYGKVYKVTIPWVHSGSAVYDGTNDHLDKYSDDPKTGANPWQFSTLSLFDAEGPVTAPLSLSLDSKDNVWVYGGTGRYLNAADKTNDDPQYFFGIKDPFFNSNYEYTATVYYHSYTNTKALAHSNLLNVDNIVVTDAGLVFDTSTNSAYGTTGKFSELLEDVRDVDGWIRSMTGGERMLTKSTVLGGIVFAPSFVPNSLACGFGGDSYLSAVYFETGTAFYKSVFSSDPTDPYTDYEGATHILIVDKISLGSGKASSLAVHAGAEEGVTGVSQLSTGKIVSESLTPVLNVKSGLTSWQEK